MFLAGYENDEVKLSCTICFIFFIIVMGGKIKVRNNKVERNPGKGGIKC